MNKSSILFSLFLNYLLLSFVNTVSFVQDLQAVSQAAFNSQLSAGWSVDYSPNGMGGYFNDDLSKTFFRFESVNPWAQLQKTFPNLDPHDYISFSFEVFIRGACNGNILQVSVDSVQVNPIVATSLNVGTASESTSFFIKGGAPHTGSSVTIKFTSPVRTTCLGFRLGIRALSFTLAKNSGVSANQFCHTLSTNTDMNPKCSCGLGQYSIPCKDCSPGCTSCGGLSGKELCSVCDAANFYQWNGEICEGCALYCDKCVFPMGTDCTSCLGNHWIYADGSCLDSCPAPMKKVAGEKVDGCRVPCEENEWLYKDLSCKGFCDFDQETDLNGIRWCKSPCENDEDYYYKDKGGVCKGSCPYPNEAEDVGGIKACALGLEEGEASKIKGMSKGINGANTGSSGAITALSFLSSSDSTSICMGAFSKMLQYIKYMKIVYPAKVEFMLEMTKANSSTNSFAAKMIGKDRFPDRELPEKFQYYGVRSSFFVNYWPALFILLALGAVTGLLILLGLSMKKISLKISELLGQVVGILKWNMILLLFCGDFGDIVFFTALELTTEKVDSLESAVSLAVCLLVNIFAFWVMAQILTVNFNIRKFKPEETMKRVQEIEMKWGNYKTLFAIYKDQSYFQQIFMFIFIIRASIFNAMIGYFWQYPLFQVVVITLTNVAMLLYLLFKRPMRAMINFIQQVILEGFLFVFNICLCILAGLDHNGTEAFDFRNSVGEVMVMINIIVPIVSIVILGVKFVILGVEAYKEWKAEKKANAKAIGRDVRIENPRKLRAGIERRNVELAVDTANKSSHILDMSSSGASFVNNSNSDAWLNNSFQGVQERRIARRRRSRLNVKNNNNSTPGNVSEAGISNQPTKSSPYLQASRVNSGVLPQETERPNRQGSPARRFLKQQRIKRDRFPGISNGIGVKNNRAAAESFANI